MNLTKEKAPVRKSTEAEQKDLAMLFDMAHIEKFGGAPTDLTVNPRYKPFADSDALDVLVSKNVFMHYGDEGHARGWAWDTFVNGSFTKDEKPPVVTK